MLPTKSNAPSFRASRKVSGMNSSNSSSSGGRRNVVSRGRYFVAAFCFLASRVSLFLFGGLILWVLLVDGASAKKEILYALAASFAVFVVTGINVLANARRVTCPLCKASLFMSTKNLVKPGVPKLLGSAKVPLAFSLLTVPKVMSCPCCAERVRLIRSGQ